MPEDQKEEQAAQPRGGNTKKLVIFSSAGLAVVIAAAFLFTTFAVPSLPESNTGEPGNANSSEPGEANPAVGPAQIYDVPVIMVNLKGSNKRKVLKVHLNLEYESTYPELASELFDRKEPEIKHVLNTLLTEKTEEELEGAAEMNMLCIELQDALNRIVFPDKSGQITKVYYQEFIIQ